MRPLRRASSLVRVIATLGVLITIQAAVVLRYGSNPRQVASWLPTDRVTLWGDVGITVDRLILLAIGCASAFGLWLLYRSSQFGLATEAVSESERSASAVGLSPNRIALQNWALGSAIAAAAGILVVPIITLQVTAMTSLILAAMAAALVGNFRSFPVATAAGFAIGIGQALVGRFGNQEGLGASLPFLVIIVVLVFRGRSLPLRDHYLEQLPMVGNGRINWAWTLFGCGAVVFIMVTKASKWTDALTVSLGVAIVLLSIVVLTGYAGQLSLAQYSIAGFGAYVAGRLVAVFHIPFMLGLLAGVAAAVPLGLIFGLPAVRTRGINLAIVTLGLGSTIELMLFKNRRLHRRRAGHPGGQPEAVRHRHRVDQVPGALRHLHAGDGAADRRRRGQRAPRAQRPAPDRGADQRARRCRARHQCDGRQAVRLLLRFGDRRARRRRPGVPAHLDQLPVVQQLHLDHLRRPGAARRRRPVARRVLRVDAGHGGRQPGDAGDDVGRRR